MKTLQQKIAELPLESQLKVQQRYQELKQQFLEDNINFEQYKEAYTELEENLYEAKCN